MNLKEFQGKEYFKRYGIRVPRSFLIKAGKKIPEIEFKELVIKAQLLTGSRKKAGLVKLVKRGDLEPALKEMFKTADEILVEERVDIEKELYLAVTVDAASKAIVCLFSEDGGINIEEVKKEDIKSFPFSEIDATDIDVEISSLFKILYKIMREIDAELVEINPLAMTEDGFVAIDSKIIVDDNALFRQESFARIKEEQLEGVEKDAFLRGIEYVDLEGDIGVIGNGAGLVMSTLDALKLSGINAANFLDVGGGASSEKMSAALSLVMEKRPKKILINIFGGITKCDEIANGIVDYKKRNGLNIPVFVRLTGSRSGEAKRILEENGIRYFESLEDAIKSMGD